MADGEKKIVEGITVGRGDGERKTPIGNGWMAKEKLQFQ